MIFNSCSSKTAQSEFDFANIMAKNELWKEALLRWEKLAQKMNNSAKLHNNLAIAYERLGDTKKAEQEYIAALKLSPKNSFIKSNYDRFKKKETPSKHLKKKKEKKNEKK